MSHLSSSSANAQYTGYDYAALQAEALQKASSIGTLLTARNMHLGTAESCTGGLIATLCTDIPGASSWFTGSVVAYSNNIKQRLLTVPEKDIITHGAVSESVVRHMAAGACTMLGTACSIAVSGIAGPSGGTKQKPVGTVWIACNAGCQTDAQRFVFKGSRQSVRMQTAIFAFHILHSLLTEHASPGCI